MPSVVQMITNRINDATKLLKQLEWSGRIWYCQMDWNPGCPICKAQKHEGHKDECALGKWLKHVPGD